MQKHRHNITALIVVLLFGLVLFFTGTDGFQAFTAESARMYELSKNNPSLPSFTLEDSQEREYKIEDFRKDKYVFVTFMYTNCGTVCPQLEMNMAKVYEKIPTKYLSKDIVFLSISFDTANDDPKTLAKYRTYFGSDGETWRMARIPDQSELNHLLNTLGVIVIPDEYGNFQHNSAFYLIGKDGTLAEIMDYTEVDRAANIVVSHLEGKAR